MKEWKKGRRFIEKGRRKAHRVIEGGERIREEGEGRRRGVDC